MKMKLNRDYTLVSNFGLSIEFKQAREIWTFTPRRNFERLLTDEIFRIAVWNTVKFAAVSVAIEIVLGLALAILASSIQSFKGMESDVVFVTEMSKVHSSQAIQMWYTACSRARHQLEIFDLEAAVAGGEEILRPLQADSNSSS